MAVVDEEEARGIECRQKQSIGQIGVRIGVFGWWARGRAFAEGMWLRWKDGKGKSISPVAGRAVDDEGMWLRWKDGKGKEDIVCGFAERVYG